MTSVSVTGTRDGMSWEQWNAFAVVVAGLFLDDEQHHFHDGDCVGADEQMHSSVLYLRESGVRIETHGHPCTISAWRAYLDYDDPHEPLPPLKRNMLMVEAADVVVAAPKRMHEERRSGTWATVRYARMLKKPVAVVWPDGSVTREDPA